MSRWACADAHGDYDHDCGRDCVLSLSLSVMRTGVRLETRWLSLRHQTQLVGSHLRVGGGQGTGLGVFAVLTLPVMAEMLMR